jgi:hypothetical protein
MESQQQTLTVGARLQQARKDELAGRFENKTEHLDPKLNYGAEAWRAPKIKEGDTVLFSECGRVLDCDYRSHWFMLVKPKFGFYTLLVHHGGGEERIVLTTFNHIVGILGTLDTHQRYLLLHLLFSIQREARSNATQETANAFKVAFVEGRLKKRKVRGQSAYKVTVETKA